MGEGFERSETRVLGQQDLVRGIIPKLVVCLRDDVCPHAMADTHQAKDKVPLSVPHPWGRRRRSRAKTTGTGPSQWSCLHTLIGAGKTFGTHRPWGVVPLA